MSIKYEPDIVNIEVNESKIHKIKIKNNDGPIRYAFIGWSVNNSQKMDITTSYQFPTGETGYLAIDNMGTISYGNFNTEKTYNIVVYTKPNSPKTLTFTINVIDSTKSDDIIGYIPNLKIIDFEETNHADLSVKNQSIPIEVEYWSINNGASLPPSKFIFENPETGYILVTNYAKIEYGNFNHDYTYNIKVKIKNFDSYTYTIQVIGTKPPDPVPPIPIPKTIAYVPNYVTIKVNQELVRTPTFSIEVEYFIILDIKYNPNDKVILDNGYVSIDTDGKISFGKFGKKANYSISIKAKDYQEFEPFIISVKEDEIVRYIPQTVTLNFNNIKKVDDGIAVLGGISSPSINYFKVNNGEEKKPGENIEYKVDNINTVGTITVRENGTISYNNLNREGIYNVEVNINDTINASFTIFVEKLPDSIPDDIPWYKKKYFGIELWIIILVSISVLIIIVVIIVYYSIKKKKIEFNKI